MDTQIVVGLDESEMRTLLEHGVNPWEICYRALHNAVAVVRDAILEDAPPSKAVEWRRMALDVIRELSRDGPGFARVDDVVHALVREPGIDDKRARAVIGSLARGSEVYAKGGRGTVALLRD